MKYPQLVSMPSAVSDWLEEQLEARGIDAVVYTRYILSLLHSDTLDVIYSHDELGLNNKESRRRKRTKCSYSDWWRNAQKDAEKLKRTAAIECLTSASEESCGFESLIDELCDRLNRIKDEERQSITTIATTTTNKIANNKKNSSESNSPSQEQQTCYSHLSPQELARKYYDAFPPLGRCSLSTSEDTKTTMKKSSASRNKRYVDVDNVGQKSMVHPLKKPRSKYEEQDANLYDDLPVDIKELLDDEEPNSALSSNVEMMNLANMRDTGTKSFISSGTNLTSSIWSSNLDVHFSSINLIDNDKEWQWSPALSMFKLNHRKESSAFVEVTTPLGKSTHQCYASPHNLTFDYCPPIFHQSYVKTVDLEGKEEDLLTSVNSHFIPINEDALIKNKYADGATFVISNNWDSVTYKRTDSGALYVDNDTKKKYCEYNNRKQQVGVAPVVDFVLKYLVCQNDKACQTDEANDAEVEAVNKKMNKMKKRQWDKDVVSMTATCGQCCNNNNNNDNVNKNMATIWNNDDVWEKVREDKDQWDYTSLRDIWTGGEICHSCLVRPPSRTVQQTTKLREDISQDGDQLLSDLSTLQKNYMEDLPLSNEVSCDLNDLLFGGVAGTKRRRSSVIEPRINNDGRDEDDEEPSWSFASRLEEDCLMQLSTLPTLRSVTL